MEIALGSFKPGILVHFLVKLSAVVGVDEVGQLMEKDGLNYPKGGFF